MIGYVKMFGKTQAGADYTEILYFDEADRPVDPEEATRVLIRDCSKDGRILREVWGICGPVRGKEA